jgi:hypothetical protein
VGGESVTGTNYLYHSLDLMAPTVKQDLDLSVDRVDGAKAKMFVLRQGAHSVSESEERRSLLVLLTKRSTNVSLLLDQQEFCVNVIGEAVLKEL